MKTISRIIGAAGGVIAMIASCCLDSPGTTSYIAGGISILGGLVAVAGYVLYVIADQCKSTKK